MTNNEGARLLGFALFNLAKGNLSATETLMRKAYKEIAGLEWDGESLPKCEAIIWHGPGHQSKTRCEKMGKHTVHRAVYGSMRQEAEWRGPEIFSGFFDEPPRAES